MDSPKKYYRCQCPHCGQRIEFPAYAAGGVSASPQCGGQVPLTKPAETAPASLQIPTQPPAPIHSGVAPRPAEPNQTTQLSTSPLAQSTSNRTATGGSRAWVWAAATLIAGLSLAYGFMKMRVGWHAGVGTATNSNPTNIPVEATASGAAPPTNSAQRMPEVGRATTASVPSNAVVPKSIADLRVTELAVQRPRGTKGAKLIYAVGVLSNDSDLQRLGVRVEVDLFDGNGAKVDSATDYREALGPRQTWQFRALVHDDHAVTARVAAVKEDS